MIPWELVGTIFLGLVKWIFERQAAKRLSDEEFLEHIRAHQKRRQNAGKAAQDFDEAMEEARKKLEEEDGKNN